MIKINFTITYSRKNKLITQRKMKLDFIDVAECKRHRYARTTSDFILVRMEAETVLFGRFIGNSRITFQSKNTMPLEPLSRYQQRSPNDK